ncbi:MAG: phosphatidylserine decarboxylase [Myxococcales bacterium]|nr:phosphatidylserine decarboxylase [Myxococcales bacterium]MCB9733547.1 phosphatidylserine decarboxylase [Deltaproteobacteria bacterium]
MSDALPGAPQRAMLQRTIDTLLGISGRFVDPLVQRSERTWLELIARPGLSRFAGAVADAQLPRPVLRAIIDGFVSLYDVDLTDMAEPLDAFGTFNAFFTRALRPGARPIEGDAETLVSPADARLDQLEPIDASGRELDVKGDRLSLAALLGDAEAASRLGGGTVMTLYLSPRDYHRVHAPIDAQVTRVEAIPGASYPVNALGRRLVPGLFATNKRVVFHLASEAFGDVALIMVGATNVGRITCSVSPGARVARGDELGIFNLGSTVVLLVPPGEHVTTGRLEGEVMRVGQALLTRG